MQIVSIVLNRPAIVSDDWNSIVSFVPPYRGRLTIGIREGNKVGVIVPRKSIEHGGCVRNLFEGPQASGLVVSRFVFERGSQPKRKTITEMTPSNFRF